ncbi:MAG: LysR substrate-binding domain-containing protein [Burkholderiaceae bacterium]
MNRSDLNTRHVEVFKAVYECGSMTLAATQLGVSQPAISALIRQLEKRIGFELFDRAGRRLRPTVEGDLFYEDVERALTGIAMLADKADDIRDRRRGRLLIGAMPALSAGFVQSLLAGLGDGDDISATLCTRHSPLLISLVALHQLDVALVAHLGPSPQVRVESLHRIPLTCLLPPAHRLYDRDIVTAADLAGERLIALSSLDRLGPRIQEMFARAGVAVRSPFSVELTLAGCGFVAQGMGVALTDPFTAKLFAPSGIIAKRFEPRTDVEIAVVRCADVTPAPAGLAAAFIQRAGEALDAVARDSDGPDPIHPSQPPQRRPP